MAPFPSFSSSSSSSSSFEAPAQLCLEEKWKLSKKDGSRSSRSSSSVCPLGKKSSSNSSTHHHRRCSFTRRCARLVKEQRARFYIMRRCVTMLICWREYTDS